MSRLLPARGTARSSLSTRVLVLTPSEGDPRAVTHVLSAGGFHAFACPDMATVAREVARDDHGGAAAVILAQEAFSFGENGEYRALADVLAAQPAWSDLPLILLAGVSSTEEKAWEIARAIDPVGNITILERPLRRTTLLNAVAVALRARARQYQLRATLQELDEHRKHLKELVDKRTAELAASTTALHASERLVSLGTLAAGLGHDIANLTFPIRARLGGLRAACSNESARADVDEIGVALTHLTRLSAGMRLMGMDPDRETASAPALELTNWAAETAPLLRACLPRNVTLECEIPSTGLGVNVARHRLAQAVFNLVQNAGEAIGPNRRGTVRVSAEAASHFSSPMVRIRISDDGPGMAPEVLARCFEPYFSTKGRAIATGMGLSLVRGIVEAAQGTVEVASAPGKGTTFTLTLPAATPARAIRTEQALASRPTAAVTVANERVGGLVRLFLDQMDLNSVRHPGPNPPDAALWVLDEPSAADLARFLRTDPSHRAVVLDGADKPAKLESLDSEAAGRVTVLPRTPTMGALRDALLRARSAG